MKKSRDLYILFLCINVIALFNLSLAQESILQKFSAEEFNNKVVLSWTIKSGNTCNGIRIFRSSDSLIYSEIGDIQGVCGNLGYSVDYNFTDNQPVKNSLNYYRLDLGGIELTHSISIEVIDVGKQNYFLKTNPIFDQSALYFNNSTNKSAQLLIYSTNGILVKTIVTQDELFMIDAIDFPNGLYFFQLSLENNELPITGKFQVNQ